MPTLAHRLSNSGPKNEYPKLLCHPLTACKQAPNAPASGIRGRPPTPPNAITLTAALVLGTPANAQTFYVSDQKNGVTALDATSFQQTAQFPTGGQIPRGIAVTHDGKFLLTANQASGDLSVLDRATGTLRVRIPIGPSAEMVRTQGDTAFVTYEPPADKGGLAHVAIVDLDRLAVTASLPSGHETEGIESSTDGKSLLVANEGDDTLDGQRMFVAAAKAGLIQVFDAKTFGRQADIKVGKRCWHFSFTQDGQHILAACGRSDALYVIDATRLRAIETIFGFKVPWGIVAYPNTNGTLDVP